MPRNMAWGDDSRALPDQSRWEEVHSREHTLAHPWDSMLVWERFPWEVAVVVELVPRELEAVPWVGTWAVPPRGPPSRQNLPLV